MSLILGGLKAAFRVLGLPYRLTCLELISTGVIFLGSSSLSVGFEGKDSSKGDFSIVLTKYSTKS